MVQNIQIKLSEDSSDEHRPPACYQKYTSVSILLHLAILDSSFVMNAARSSPDGAFVSIPSHDLEEMLEGLQLCSYECRIWKKCLRVDRLMMFVSDKGSINDPCR